jgi:hypothetical protein
MTRQVSNGYRRKALEYFRAGRVRILESARDDDQTRAELVYAEITPAPGDPSGYSQPVTVTRVYGRWTCTADPTTPCAHRLAVQQGTGWAHLGGAL